jgi:transcriptional regulator with XRE-family HTH domain
VELTIGQRLKILKAHSHLSLAEIANRGGYRGASSIQKLFRDDYNPMYLPNETAERLAKALVGAGSPAIEADEIYALVDQIPDRFKSAYADALLHQHAADRIIFLEQTSRIQRTFLSDEGIETPLFVITNLIDNKYFESPMHIRPFGIQALYVSVGSMWPRFEEGEAILYATRRYPRVGEDVIVKLIDDEYVDGALMLGRLINLNDSQVQVRQFSPSGFCTIDRSNVISVRPILARDETIAPTIVVKKV